MRKNETQLANFARMVFNHAIQDRKNAENQRRFEQSNPGQTFSPYKEAIFAKHTLRFDAILALNEESPVGYIIPDLPSIDGKRPMSEMERVSATQERLWGTKGKDLKEGDCVWPHRDLNGREYHVGHDDPIKVDEVTKKGVIFDLGRDGTERGGLDETFIKPPVGWDETEDQFNEEFWLKKAEELGIK